MPFFFLSLSLSLSLSFLDFSLDSSLTGDPLKKIKKIKSITELSQLCAELSQLYAELNAFQMTNHQISLFKSLFKSR